MSESLGYEAAKIDGFGLRPEVRNNDRVLYKQEARAEELWQIAQPWVPPEARGGKAVGLNKLIRFYRYAPGQAFKQHADGRYWRNKQEVSVLTFIAYLNDDFEGGETLFREHTITPKTGMALCFTHHLLHEGAAVTKGVKYVLRSDVMYRL